MIVLYPGCFDPMTRGHLDIIGRASRLFDQVVVLVMSNPRKRPMISAGERCRMVARLTRGMENVRVEADGGALIDAVRRLGAHAILRGLRDNSDYAEQRAVADAFYRVCGVETLFIQSDPALGYISSSLAREIINLGVPAGQLVPEEILPDVLAAARRPDKV